MSDQPPVRRRTRVGPPEHPRRGEILLIEDTDATRRPFAQLLRGRGYTVLEATNGQEALAQLRARGHDVALIILDLFLPIMDGWEFREAQLKDPDIAEIATVVLTTAPQTRVQDYVLQADEYLYKPVAADRLLEVVSSYCEAGRRA